MFIGGPTGRFRGFTLFMLGFSILSGTLLAQAPPPTRSSASVRPRAEISACSLLTKAEVGELLGESVQDPNSTATGGVSTCTWMSDKGGVVSLLMRKASNAGEAETVRKQALAESKNQSGVAPQEIQGLGDGAYWAGGKLNQLNVFKGVYWILINASSSKNEDQLELSKAIALRVVPKVK